MHRAPPVTLSISRSIWQIRCMIFLAMLALMAQAALFFAWRISLFVEVAGFVLTGVLVAWASLRWHSIEPSQLAWDGHQWNWSGFGTPGSCLVQLSQDWGRAVVLTLKSQSGAQCLIWIDADPDRTVWSAVRRAVVSSPTAWTSDADTKCTPSGVAP